MNILYNNEELLQLMSNLCVLTGIRSNIFDLSGKDVCLDYERQPFCELMNSIPEGHMRCVECDKREVAQCAKTKKTHFYRCHAGLCEAIVPVCANDVPIAYLAFGQFLDNSPVESQWQNALKGLEWYTDDIEVLHRNFCKLHCYSANEIHAYAEVLKAIASYIQLSGMIQMTELTDIQRLDLYLDQHYMEKVSLSTISEELDISRTKLCALAKQLSGGKTLSQIIAQRRVEAAKLLLLKTNDAISSVAESVGIPDYNYFTKIFRSVTGLTPSAYRSKNRHIE